MFLVLEASTSGHWQYAALRAVPLRESKNPFYSPPTTNKSLAAVATCLAWHRRLFYKAENPFPVVLLVIRWKSPQSPRKKVTKNYSGRQMRCLSAYLPASVHLGPVNLPLNKSLSSNPHLPDHQFEGSMVEQKQLPPDRPETTSDKSKKRR